jgi:integrase
MVSALTETKDETVSKKAKLMTVLDMGASEPGMESFLDGCDRAGERSKNQYRRLTGMVRRKALSLGIERPLVELDAGEAQRLARALKETESAAGMCAHMRQWYARNDRPELVRMFKKKPKPTAVDRDDVPTDQEAQAMIDACRSMKDRALLGAMFECGSRISEVLAARLRDVEVQTSSENGGRKLVTIWFRKSKVPGEQHFFTFVDSATLLTAWLAKYPFPTKGGEAPLFPSEARKNYGGTMTYGGAYKKFWDIVRASGIREPERFHPHSAKHYAVTRMLRKGMTEADVKKAVGWKPNSAMLARYSHLTETDSRNAYLRASGLKVADAPRVEPFSVPTKDVPPVVAAPPSVVDLSDPRLAEQLDRWIVLRAKAMGLDTSRLMEPFSPSESEDPEERASAVRDAK